MDRVSALVWLRWRIWRHGLQTVAGASNAAAGIVMTIVGTVGAVGLATGCGLVIWMIASDGDAETLGVALVSAFYVMLLFGVVVPLVVGGSRTGRELAPLVVLPITSGSLYRLSLASSAVGAHHVFWYPSLAAVGLTLMVGAGIDPLLGGCLLLALLVVFVVWSHALLHLLGLVLRRRRTREVITVAAFVVLVVVSVIPAAVEELHGEKAVQDFFSVTTFPAAAAAMARLLPPSLAADGLKGLVEANPAPALWGLAWMFGWVIGGVGVGWPLFRRHLLEPNGPGAGGGATAHQRRRMIAARIDELLDLVLPQRLAAVVAKNVRYLFRSTPGKLAMALAPIIAAFAGLAFAHPGGAPVLGIDVVDLAFIGMLLYSSMLVSNFVVNAFAWDGGGFASYLLAPVEPMTVIVGKNLAVGMFSGVLVAEAVAAWAVTRGLPGPTSLLSGLLVSASGVIGLMIAGNFTSVVFPVPRSIASAYSSPSQAAMLISFAVLLGNAALVGMLILLADLGAGAWLRPILLAAYLGALVVAYASLLRPAAALLLKRREHVAAALDGTYQG